MDQKHLIIMNEIAQKNPVSLRKLNALIHGSPERALSTTKRKIDDLRLMGLISQVDLSLSLKGQFFLRQQTSFFLKWLAVAAELSTGDGWVSTIPWRERLRELNDKAVQHQLHYLLNGETAATLLSDEFQTTNRVVFLINEQDMETWLKIFSDLNFQQPRGREIFNVVVYPVPLLPTKKVVTFKDLKLPVVTPERNLIESLVKFGRAITDAIYLYHRYRDEMPFTINGLNNLDTDMYAEVLQKFKPEFVFRYTNNSTIVSS